MSVLSTSTINSLIRSYEATQRAKLITPLESKKSVYNNRSSSYGELSSKLSSLKSLLTNFKLTGSESVFATKKTTSSDSSFVTASASSSASISSYELFVNQLAKSDIAVSQDMLSATANAINGTHTFSIVAGDGEGGEFVSNVEVELDTDETNQTMMEKIRNAINSDKAVVESSVKTAASAYSGGASTITFDINGTETEVELVGGGTYEELIDELVGKINDDVDGVTAEKVLDSPSAGDVSLKLTVEDSNDYISISHTSGFDLVTDLGIDVTQEKGASGMVSASVFTPRADYHQFSITAKNTGIDYRIKGLSDTSGTVLSELGLNLGTSRPSFDQSQDPDTAGFVYSDITDANNLLNSKFEFNGLDIQKSSNDVEDLVGGVTFQLNSTMQASDNNVSIGVANNTEDVKSQIDDFIKKFNDIYSYIRENSKSEDDVRGVFRNDSNASSILSSLQSVAYSQVSGIPSSEASYLSQIGISFDYQSGLKISDSDLLETKIDENVDQVEALFNSENGIANTLWDKIDPYLGSDGYLAMAQDSITNTVSYLTKRITAVEERVDSSAAVLRNRYQQMQAQLAGLMSAQSMFSSGGLDQGYF